MAGNSSIRIPCGNYDGVCTFPNAVPSQPVIYEAQGFSHVLEKLPRAVGDRWKQTVNYTCLDASEAHLVVGSEQGIIYVVNVSSGKLVCKLTVSVAESWLANVHANDIF